MIIKELYINNFGKFNNFQINFSEGFNLIYGENESGKTTLLNFIMMILYGTYSKSTDILQNDRKKYKPWNNETMKGSIVIYKDQIDYKIERTFKASNQTDIVEVFDLNTGKKIEIPDPKIPGKFFFNMGFESFKKTLFISSESIVIDNNGSKDEIIKKLINIVTTGEEDISYKKVIKNIDDKIENYSSKSGHRGFLVEINKKLDSLKIELEESKNDEEDKKYFMNQVESLQKSRDEVLDTIVRLEEAIKYKNEKDEIRIKKSQFELKKNQLQSNIKTDEIENLKDKFNSVYNKNNFNNLLILLTIFSIIFSFSINKYFYVISLILIILYIYNFINFLNKKKLSMESIRINLEKYENYKNKTEKEIGFINQEIYHIDNLDIELSNKIDNLGFSFFELNYGKMNELKNQSHNYENRITSIISMTKERYRGKRNQSTIIKDIEETNKELLALEKEFSLLLKTKEFIEKGFREVGVGFSKKLNEKTSKIISKITNGKYDSIFISSDFNISILDTKTNDIKEWKYLSNGTIDQLYLSLRLSIIDLVIDSKSDRILFLDDIFIRYDDVRAKETLSFFEENKNSLSQILSFTCHDFSGDSIRDYNYIKL